MQADVINIGLGFFEGFALIISPCILPILPIILSGSLAGNKSRPIGIIIGFILFFSVFTYFSRKITEYSGVESNLIRQVAYGLLIFFGIIMLSSFLTEQFARLTQRLSSIGSSWSTANDAQGGFWSGLLFGGLVAVIWTPCAGPILAAVIVQIVIQKSNLMIFLILLAFGTGAVLPMLVIALLGRSIMSKFYFFKTHAELMRKILGLIIIVSVGYMILTEGAINVAHADEPSTALTMQNGLSNPYPAPAIGGISAWINSMPLSLNQLKGKVVLIDFWTYSCINCVRTLPYLRDWYAKYHQQGFEIIGVHTPEFDFERNLNNVKSAVMRDKITYPVALDNQFVTWQNFNNRYWPAHFLIDQNGNVVYTHFGEGEYDVTENNIQYLLKTNQPAHFSTIPKESISAFDTPETYLGYARAEYFSTPDLLKKNSSSHYTLPDHLSTHQWGLQGNWKIFSDRIVSDQNNAIIKIRFYARQVFIVMGTASSQPIQVKFLLNDRELITHAGKDVHHSSVMVSQHALYEIVSLNEAENGFLSVIATAPELEVYTFTFG